MSTQSIIANASRIPNELYNKGNLAILAELFTPGYVEHTPLPHGFPTGVEAVRLFVTLVRTAFPDFHYTIEDLFVGGDRLTMRVTASGTQRGDFMGIPATGHSATWQEIHIARLEGDRLAEHWVVVDQLGMLQQLGVIPTAEAA